MLLKGCQSLIKVKYQTSRYRKMSETISVLLLKAIAKVKQNTFAIAFKQKRAMIGREITSER